MLSLLGTKIRQLREEQDITREVFCGDETELSVRQLARIESGQCLPSLERAVYIANRLNMDLTSLTGGEGMELPKGYRDIKYEILRIPTFTNPEKIEIRERQYDEILEYYYDDLPEEERIVIDAMCSMLEVQMNEDATFGIGLLEEYFEQIKTKSSYQMNDLILINLYFQCLAFENGSCFKDEAFHKKMLERLLKREGSYETEELFIVNRILINLFSYFFDAENFSEIDNILSHMKRITKRIQDLQRMPILNLMEWKCYLFASKDAEQAEICYEKAMMFANMMEDDYLRKNLKREWEEDTR